MTRFAPTVRAATCAALAERTTDEAQEPAGSPALQQRRVTVRRRNRPDVRHCEGGALFVSMEDAVQRDLAELPDSMRRGGIASVALMCARILDEGGLAPRDAAGFAREMRLSLAQLREMAPGEVKGDPTDDTRERRERRLTVVDP